ncbi:fimbrial chaperone [Citrobacter youngae]|nr:fimbrial chaperone [Citrobacter youngae]
MRSLPFAMCSLLFSLLPIYAQADIVLSGTRIIYPEGQSSVTVHLDNKGQHPLLVQTWLDDGEENKAPEQIQTPFILTPPITRIDAEHGQTVRILYTGGKLPEDQEKLYWFNVLEVPPKDKSHASENKLQLAFRTRIKFIYRPKSLNGDLESALKQVDWAFKNKGGKTFLSAKNNSPYYLSLDNGAVLIGGQKYTVNTSMLIPHGEVDFLVTAFSSADISKHGKITYSAINDFGGETSMEKTF